MQNLGEKEIEVVQSLAKWKRMALADYGYPAEWELDREYGAVYIIGDPLKDGTIHGGRAPDYDGWTTVAENGTAGLNGDILAWDPVPLDSLGSCRPWKSGSAKKAFCGSCV